jgi:hypothetical protein
MITASHTPAISVKFSPNHLAPSSPQAFDECREDPEWIVGYPEVGEENLKRPHECCLHRLGGLGVRCANVLHC